MQFAYLGINYKDAQLAVRDKTSFTDAMKLEFFQRAESAGVEQCMVLSTCNRSEVFYFFKEKSQTTEMQRIYGQMFPEVETDAYLRMLSGEEAMAYLFRIAAGVESLVLGEDQILGQVKEALDYARTMGYSGKELNKVVRDAITCAKQIKTELKISEKPLSVSYVGIQKLKESCGISGKKILLVGSGKTASLALKYICEYPRVQVTACSRNYAHARLLREKFPDIEIVPYDARYEVMGMCDIVISATSSPHLVIRKEDFCPSMPVTFLDLATPRDVDIRLGENPLVNLLNLDTLQTIVTGNQKEREYLVNEGKKRIEESLPKTLLWLLQSRMDATIESLQQRCDEIVADSYGYLNRKMDLSAREQKLLKKVLHASLLRLLREPIQELKRLDTEDEQEKYKHFVESLFQIG